MSETSKARPSDDEDDLESLRLAALQTLNKNGAKQPPNLRKTYDFVPKMRDGMSPYQNHKRMQGYGLGKRGRFYGSRGAKNGHFHGSRAISSNLISLTPTEPSENLKPEASHNKFIGESAPETKSDEASSKFDRYKDSDKSEDDDTDEEILKSDSEDETATKLTRSASLEALMQELDNEIQGKTKPQSIPVEEKCEQIAAERDVEKKVANEPIAQSEAKETPPKEDVKAPVPEPKPKPPENVVEESVKTKEKSPASEPLTKRRRHNAPPFQQQRHQNYRGKTQNFASSFVPQPMTSFVPYPQNNLAFPGYGPAPEQFPPPIVTSQPFYERPLSPLRVDTSPSLQVQSMAPLSPRSAAFVLQNRAIIEQRKRSPKRPYSRSPSPRGWSISPRSSPNRRRSLSPRKRSRSPRRRSPSPRRRPLSPARKSVSPKGALSPRRRPRKGSAENAQRNKPTIRDRLGFKSRQEEKNKPKSTDSPKSLKDQPVDPVLEARKKKFESNEIKVKEGVIRLKPKQESVSQEKHDKEVPKPDSTDKKVEMKVVEEDKKEEESAELDDELDLDSPIELLFDEESCDEIEDLKPPVAENNIKDEKQVKSHPAAPCTSENNNRRSTKEHHIKSGSSLQANIIEKPTNKKVDTKSERLPKKIDRKIEIKIKSPTKYDRSDRKAEASSDRKRTKLRNSRKVEVQEEVERHGKQVEEEVNGDDDNDDTEIVIENETDEAENVFASEGDLRAQLSKKRAAKLQKTTSTTTTTLEGVPTRLLKNALQNALPMKKSKKTKSKQLSSSDSKPSIHMRLGFPEVFSKSKKKSKKRKRAEDQV